MRVQLLSLFYGLRSVFSIGDFKALGYKHGAHHLPYDFVIVYDKHHFRHRIVFA